MLIPYRNLGRFLRKAALQPAYAWRVFLRRSQALARQGSGISAAAAPESVTIFLTHRCNLRCAMCGQWGEHGVTGRGTPEMLRRELSGEQLRSLVDELARFRPSVTLFGGEPLLHPECAEVIRRIKARGMHCLMITNGTLLKERARELVESGLDELNVSIDGPRDLHDAIRGARVFDAIREGIGLVQRLKREAKKKRPLVNIQCTINRQNQARLGELARVCEELEADSLTFHNLIFLTGGQIAKQRESDSRLGWSSGGWEGFVFEPGVDSAALVKTLEGLRRSRAGFNVDVYPNFGPGELRRYYGDPDFFPRDYPARCLSPWLVCYVFPDGSVRPCLNSEYSFGNIRDEAFTRVWNSAAAKGFRKTLAAKKLFPACVRCTELYRY